MTRRLLHTGIGVALIAAGVYGWLVLDHRSEWVVLVLVGFGGFLVSKSATLGALAAARELLGGVWDGMRGRGG